MLLDRQALESARATDEDENTLKGANILGFHGVKAKTGEQK